MKFNSELRQQVSSDILPLLDKFETIAADLASQCSQTVIWQEPEQLPKLLDLYLDSLLTVYLNKYALLCESTIQALNAGNFLIYGLIGRALIEHTAILRYYVTSKLLPLTEAAVADGVVTESEWEELISWLHRHLTGHRFDWEAFLSGYLDDVETPDVSNTEDQKQVNVLTCLEKWIKEKPSLGKLYQLFCDLVHPNLGSTLLISRLVERQIGIGGYRGTPIGLEIMNRTFADLVGLFSEVHNQLIQLKSLKSSNILQLKSKNI